MAVLAPRFVVRLSPSRVQDSVDHQRFFGSGFSNFVPRFVQFNLEVTMNMIKTLVLGSAAGLLALGGAQAADLPVKAKAVEYVRICSLYGAGFFYIPGTDTCIKLGGYLRADTTFNGWIYGAAGLSGSLGAGDRFADFINSRSRMALTVDTR